MMGCEANGVCEVAPEYVSLVWLVDSVPANGSFCKFLRYPRGVQPVCFCRKLMPPPGLPTLLEHTCLLIV